jgi:hypothetical protein
MASENLHWGTERIRGELLKLGIAVSARFIRHYRRRGPARPPSQSWSTFLANHAQAIWAADLFVVQTLTFQTPSERNRGRGCADAAPGVPGPHPAAEREARPSGVDRVRDLLNLDRPHRSLGLETPVPSRRPIAGEVVARPVLGGLHHVYERAA